MDQTTKPLLIPPEFALYAEKHGIFDLYQRLLKQLIIQKPDEPIQFLIDIVKKDVNSPAIVVLGPPASGKKTISRVLSQKTGAVLLNKNNLLENIPVSLNVEFGKLNKDQLKPEHWAKVIKHRIDDYDCVRKGWILENYPQTREQALAMLAIGAIPKHCVFLEAADIVLIERAAGKQIDVKTGEIYHTTFHMPTDNSIRDRLKVPSNYTENEIKQRLVVYHRHLQGLQNCLSSNAKVFNVDQPRGDVVNQVFEFTSRPARTVAPITPRIIFIGPTGSGRRTQANLIAKKYDIVNISMSQLIKQAIASDSILGNACKGYIQKKTNVPDTLVLQLLRERLGQLDCVSKGWILHGFPKTRDQAESLERAGFIPNRVFFFDIPNDSIMERLTLRYIDPVTGENYHILYNPPLSQEVKDRLKQSPSHTEDSVRIKLAEYSSNINDLNEYYENRGIYINADPDRKAVFETIEFGIVNQIAASDPDAKSS